MIAIQKELKILYEKYRASDFLEYYKKAVKESASVGYSKGLGFFAGLYEPSYVTEMRVVNHTVGRKIKNPEKGFDYKYYFDGEGRVMLSEKYIENTLSYLNFYFYHGQTCEFICYNLRGRCITLLSSTAYDGCGRPLRHIEAETEGEDIADTAFYEEQLFRYENDTVFITENSYRNDSEQFKWLDAISTVMLTTTYMMIKNNTLFYLNGKGETEDSYPLRFKLNDGKKIVL